MDRKFETNPNTMETIDAHYRKLTPEKERFNEWMMPYIKNYLEGAEHVLEVGCGMGRDLAELTKFKKRCRFYGLDISGYAIEQAKKAYPDLYFYSGDIEKFTVRSIFDLVFCSQTLEHVDDPNLAINKMKDFCKVWGHLFITVPWPKSNLDNGVKSHYWRFYEYDFKKILPNCTIHKEGNNMIVTWRKPK